MSQVPPNNVVPAFSMMQNTEIQKKRSAVASMYWDIFLHFWLILYGKCMEIYTYILYIYIYISIPWMLYLWDLVKSLNGAFLKCVRKMQWPSVRNFTVTWRWVPSGPWHGDFAGFLQLVNAESLYIYTLQGTLQNWLFRGYVSSQEGIPYPCVSHQIHSNPGSIQIK